MFVIAVVLVLVALVLTIVGVGRWRFARASARAVDGLLARVGSTPLPPLAAADLAGLPAIVRTWVTRSGALGRPPPRVVHLRQRGALQTARGGRWMPFRAEQWFTPTDPGFVWIADVAAAPGIHLAGRDACVDGRGSMRIELLSLVPVVRASGPRIDQGALVRYLAEMIWFPGHAAAPYLRWEEIDATRARATLVDGAATVSGVFTFAGDGELRRFEARRYLDETLTDWVIDVESDGERGGLRIPVRASVTWRLADGPWTWLRLEIVDLEA